MHYVWIIYCLNMLRHKNLRKCALRLDSVEQIPDTDRIYYVIQIILEHIHGLDFRKVQSLPPHPEVLQIIEILRISYS